ncbi:Pantothenate kinase [Monosporozyma unispora]|nr:Pantothenate kinase [Kazachstania unispora]
MTTENTQEINYQCDYSTRIFTIALDIGGTLAKIIYSPLDSNKLMFHTIETEKIESFIKFLHNIILKWNQSNYNTTMIIATGGGAFKFYDLLNNEFPILYNKINQFDEMECLIKGLDFFIHKVNQEVFTYNDQDGIQEIEQIVNTTDNNTTIYPYMLVNIGSGVSILKVEKPNVFTRVGGSSLGGGTLWGLLSLITGAKTYDQMLTWAQNGNNDNVDMLVGDIYGTDYSKIGLKSSSIASSFAKVFQNRKPTPTTLQNNNNNSREQSIDNTTTSTQDIQDRNKKFKNEDISKSLLYAISNNIGQIAYLQAKIHNVQNVYFGGSYIRGHLTTMNTLSYAINFWSEGSKQAFFLKHEGYLGAMGAFLKSSEI